MAIAPHLPEGIVMSATIAARKAQMALLYLAAFGLLLILYAYYLVPLWSYMGFEADPNGAKIAVAAGVIAAFSLATPIKTDTRSFFLNMMLTVYLLPSMAIYAFANKPTSSALTIWIAFAVVYIASSIPVPRVTLFGIRTQTLMWGLALATACLLVAYYAFGGMRNFNLDISKVYQFRKQASEALPGAFAYISSVFAKFVIPFGLIASIIYRRYDFSILFVISSIFLFGFTSNKSVIFSPIMVLLVFIFVNRYKSYSIILLIFITILIIGIFNIYVILIDGQDNILGWYNTLLIRRAIALPPLIDYHYLEYFSKNPFYHWSDSRITLGLLPAVYDLPPPNLIGKLFFGSANTSANTGFIGSGFAQGGMIGVLLYSAGVGLILSILRTYGRYLGFPFVTATMVDMVFVMIRSTDFLTLFLTHGLLLALVLLSSTHPPMPGETAKPRRNSSPEPAPAEES
jgi:hypothetical protein